MSELNHHGIQGQKWGKRRYQNPDGTLTAEGRIRYNSDGSRRKLDQRTNEYYKSVKKKRTEGNVKATVAAGSAAAMLTGLAGWGMMSIPLSMVSTATINAGRNAILNHKMKKELLADQAGLVKSGKKWVDKIHEAADKN